MTGPEFRRRRRALNLTQAEFAQALGYKPYHATIWRKEVGHRKVTRADERLLEALEAKDRLTSG